MHTKTTVGDRHIVETFVAKVREVLGEDLERAYWFGSRARKAGGKDSDSDLLLETAQPLTGNNRDQIADIAIDMAADYGALMDVHVYSADLLKNPMIARSPFLLTVHEAGVEI